MPFDTAVPASPSAATRTRCELCPAARACLAGTPGLASACWNSVTRTPVSLPTPGKTLFESGDPAVSIYLVRAGCLKSFTVDEEGNEHVRGFYLPGDVIGLDAVGAAAYPASVAAVSAAQVCRLSMADLRRLLLESPALMQRLLERTSRDLAEALALAGDYTAEQRVAAFLLAMQHRLGGAAVKLPMTRRDIANYLRLATETVCRVLTRLETQGQIRSDSRKVELLDGGALRALAQAALPLARAA